LCGLFIDQLYTKYAVHIYATIESEKCQLLAMSMDYIGKYDMITESPYCCKMYANFPRCTHLGNIITVMLYNMTESESQICCKMYENDAICMQMRLRYMSNVYTVSLFPQSKQYKGPNNAKYVRMYKVQHHRCMYTVHVGRCSTESTPNNLFMHLVCPPPAIDQ